MQKTEKIVFGGGCFWCTEAIFKMLKGIVSLEPGYSGGTKPNPTYFEVCDGNTGHIEVVQIEYDPLEISFEKLLTVFLPHIIHQPKTVRVMMLAQSTILLFFILLMNRKIRRKNL